MGCKASAIASKIQCSKIVANKCFIFSQNQPQRELQLFIFIAAAYMCIWHSKGYWFPKPSDTYTHTHIRINIKLIVYFKAHENGQCPLQIFYKVIQQKEKMTEVTGVHHKLNMFLKACIWLLCILTNLGPYPTCKNELNETNGAPHRCNRINSLALFKTGILRLNLTEISI